MSEAVYETSIASTTGLRTSAPSRPNQAVDCPAVASTVRSCPPISGRLESNTFVLPKTGRLFNLVAFII